MGCPSERYFKMPNTRRDQLQRKSLSRILESLQDHDSSRRVRGPYKPRITAWQKVNAIIKFMQREYRWTVKDFIRNFITAEEDHNKRSIEIRKKTLKEAVIGQEMAFRCFEDTGDISVFGMVSIQQMQTEMILQDNRGYFGQFSDVGC